VRPCHSRTIAAARRGGGFTLVELITAASLMTVMMLGVVEIFGIVTDTASEAESQNFGNQQLRSFFDALNRDIHGMTRQGYFQTRAYSDQWNDTQKTLTQVPQTPNTIDGNLALDAYPFYTLAFVSVGPWSKSLHTDTFDSTTKDSADALAAEVVYTNNVWTTTSGSSPSLLQAGKDPRRGVLGRGVWIMNNSSNAGSDGSDQQSGDYARSFGAAGTTTRFLVGLMADSSTSSLSGNSRIKQGDGQYVTVWPALRSNTYTSTKPGSLARAMATCATEFLVECWKEDTTTPANSTWDKSQFTDTLNWPKAIRVTAVVTNPDTLEPLPSGQKRFQGYGMQEVYWLGDP